MRIAFAYGRYAAGNKVLSPQNMTTGSEWSCCAFAREMVHRGHKVSLYLPRRRAHEILDPWEGVRVRELTFLRSEPHDVVIAWNEPDLLRHLDGAPKRVCNQQLNDFWYAGPGYDDYVDIYTSPSESHLFHLRDQTPSPHKWRILPNGCDPAIYKDQVKVPGRVIYASSPDRGLHQLLPLWPQIQQHCPTAHLRIFYDMGAWLQLTNVPENKLEPRHVESRRRAGAVLAILNSLNNIEILGQINREAMVKEMCAAEILAYPCDPYAWTEGFSVTTMEACAAGCIPVITDADALGEIYGEVCPMVRRLRVGKIETTGYVELMATWLNDHERRAAQAQTTKTFAEAYAWPVLAERLEGIIS